MKLNAGVQHSTTGWKGLCVSLLLHSSISHAAGNVTLYPGNQHLNTVERIEDLVTLPSLSQSWWPAAVISEKQAQAVEESQHQKLLATLAEFAAQEEGDDAVAINSVRQQLQAIHVTGRQFINLDPDWIRTHPADNVPLQGDYSLWVGTQPSNIMVTGLVSAPGSKPFIPGHRVDEYLADMNTLAGAERSYAWVIYPDGKIQKAPIAYWNRRHIELTPGSLIFVGFADRLFNADFNTLNQQILRSLTHRRPD